MTPDEFRSNGYVLIDWIAQYIEGVEQFPVGSQVHPGDIRASLPEHPPASAQPFSDVLADLDRVVMPGITWQHRAFAYFGQQHTRDTQRTCRRRILCRE